MIPVQSSTIVAIGYDPDSRVLTVQFKSGTYRFRDVPPPIWEGFLAAPSKGSYFHVHIRGQFVTEKL